MLNVMTTTSGIDGAQEHYGMGVDVGGSGIKGAIVNLKTGEFVGDRIKIATLSQLHLKLLHQQSQRSSVSTNGTALWE